MPLPRSSARGLGTGRLCISGDENPFSALTSLSFLFTAKGVHVTVTRSGFFAASLIQALLSSFTYEISSVASALSERLLPPGFLKPVPRDPALASGQFSLDLHEESVSDDDTHWVAVLRVHTEN